MTHIPDPDAPHLRAIDTTTGHLAHGVFLVPPGTIADPAAPTAAEIAATTPEHHIGWVDAQDALNRFARPIPPQEDQ